MIMIVWVPVHLHVFIFMQTAADCVRFFYKTLQKLSA